nr:hypothetical protein [Tanacetum cinerariifolium]
MAWGHMQVSLTAGFAPVILSNPMDVIKDRVMKGQLIVWLTQLRRKCRWCSTIRFASQYVLIPMFRMIFEKGTTHYSPP